jgi:cell division protein FtsB
MEYQHIIDSAFGIAFTVAGWFAREMWAAVKDLKSDLAKLREELPKTYVTRDDYREDMREIKEMLGKIFDKLDTKLDK